MENVGYAIKKIRKSKGITVEQLASGICHKNTLTYIEKGTNSPSIELLFELSEKLGVEVDTIYKEAKMLEHNEYMMKKMYLLDLIEQRDFTKIEQVLSSVSQDMYESLPILEQQFVDMYQAEILFVIYHDAEASKTKALESLYKTYNRKSNYFSREEVILINMIFRASQGIEEMELATKAYKWLKSREAILRDNYALLLLTHAFMVYAYISENWSEVHRFSIEGEILARREDKARFISNFIFAQGIALFHLEHSSEKAKLLIKDALLISLSFKHKDIYESQLNDLAQFSIEM